MSSLADIYALPEEKRAELIDGVLYMLAPPSPKHQRIVYRLTKFLDEHIENHNGNCEVYLAPCAVFLNENDDKNYLEPDIFVVCDKDKIKEDGCHGAPDLVVEVLSPGTRNRDLTKKLFKYAAAGVREYWIVDPLRNIIDVHLFEREVSERYGFDEKVPVSILNGAAVVLNNIL